MHQNITSESLISYYYNELTPSDSAFIEEALKCNTELLEEYQQLEETLGLMDQIELLPNPTSIALIMEHSAKTATVHHV
ncbi:MAG: hypothetical protein MUC81_10895 [Bacteroidia bacterium]|jgi:hypothetical protein|nr:hypothetical protein [Bacteroidia bacterium]